MPAQFPTPFAVTDPPGSAGWQQLYPYYVLFDATQCPVDGSKFWFCDLMHWPEPVYPFDASIAEFAIAGLGQYNTRLFCIPPAFGIELRVLHGYCYLSPVPVTDPNTIAARQHLFEQRAGYYFENWETLYAQWKQKVVAEIEMLRALPITALPDVDALSRVHEGVGLSRGYELLRDFDTIIGSAARIWQYHFEFLNLGYLAYLDLSQTLRQLFPDIRDQTIAQMVAGMDIDLYRPDNELKRLAQLAYDKGLASYFEHFAEPDKVLQSLKQEIAGEYWCQQLEVVRYPWFCFSSGTGFYHDARSWSDDLSVPLAAIHGYINNLQQGRSITRNSEQIAAQAQQLIDEHRALLHNRVDISAFDQKLQLAQRVYRYVEEHNFYVEHWHHSVLWNKVREIGGLLAQQHFFADADDVFYLQRSELSQALFDLYSAWSAGVAPRGPHHWPAIVAQRKSIMAALRQQQPWPVLGNVPKEINEPFTIMLWGILSDRVQQAMHTEHGDIKQIKGHAASPGVVEGIARVVLSRDQLNQVNDGDILVCPITAPSWAPVFARARAVVTNVGGMMSHAAILCREYHVPAVVGTLMATRQIKDGARIRVDGDHGVVELL